MRVQIVYPDDGWVLTRLAKDLIEGLPYVEGVIRDPDPSGQWDIVYYFHYLIFMHGTKLRRFPRRPRNARRVGGWFTHRADDRFDKIAKKFDFCVSPCNRYRDYLRDVLGREAYVIRHGIDTDRFTPKIRLGFIGRLARDGRKGEELIARISELPYVEIIETGGKLSEEEIPDIYHRIDYVLITSTIEGGPLCLQEGLASGKEVISTDVGMVSDLAGAPGVHIYRSAEELLALLQAKYEERLVLRRAVERYTIDYFVEEHDKLFHAQASRVR